MFTNSCPPCVPLSPSPPLTLFCLGSAMWLALANRMLAIVMQGRLEKHWTVEISFPCCCGTLCHVSKPELFGWRMKDHVDERRDNLAEALPRHTSLGGWQDLLVGYRCMSEISWAQANCWPTKLWNKSMCLFWSIYILGCFIAQQKLIDTGYAKSIVITLKPSSQASSPLLLILSSLVWD